MALEGCARIIKYLVFFFNFIFFLCGVGLLGVGIYVHLKIGDYVELSSVKYVTGSIIIIAVGTIIAVVAFFGCCGAVRESRCLLGTFFGIMLVILGLEITGTALGFVYRDELESKFEGDLNNTLNQYGEKGMDGVTKAFNYLQEKEKCCGVHGFKDWQRTQFTLGNHSIVPDSCCKEVKDSCGVGFKEANIHTKGCFEVTIKLLKDNLMIIGGAGAGVAAIQILAMIFALVLICKLKEQSTYA